MRIVFLVIFVVLNGCATKGLLSDRYEESYYHIPDLLTEEHLSKDPTFIVVGDTQPAWRALHKFTNRENWHTKKMLLFPFYQAYWLWNGAVGYVNYLRHMPDYGYDTRAMMREAVYNRAKGGKVDFILNTGDIMGQDGRRPANWKMFLDEFYHDHPLLKEIPFVPTPGNHERCNDFSYGRKNFEAVYDYPLFYTVEFPSIDLFVVDSDVIVDWKDDQSDDVQDSLFIRWFASDDPDNPGWLESELARSTKPFKVVSMHHCPFSYGYHWEDWYKPGFGKDAEHKRNKMVELFRKYRVQVVFSGHDHIYQHNILRWQEGEVTPEKDIHFVVSSGGGTPLRNKLSEWRMNYLDRKYLGEGFPVETIRQDKVYHYCEVVVDDEKLQITTIEVPEKDPVNQTILEEIIIPSPSIKTKIEKNQTDG